MSERAARWLVACLLLLVLVNGCVQPTRDTGVYGSQATHRFQQPAARAAQCFARNAEEHSSALVSEVRVRGDGSAEVIVRVKNGVTYATAEINPAGNASSGSIHLMVKRSGAGRDLLEELTEGC